MILKRLIYVLVCMSFIGCSINNSTTDNKNNRIYKIDEIPDNAVENNLGLYENNFPPFFVIKFSNIIYGALLKGELKKIRIPIFQGTLDDVYYTVFLKYCEEKNMLKSDWMESGFVILTKRGEVKKTLLEFIKFYEGNILKGYEKPEMYRESGMWGLEYKFKIEKVPCRMVVTVWADKRDLDLPYESYKSFKSIEDIHPNENMEKPHFRYKFRIDWDEQ
jgi:hypothetical protein